MFRIFCSYRKFNPSVKDGVAMGIGTTPVESERRVVEEVWCLIPTLRPGILGECLGAWGSRQYQVKGSL